MKLYLPKFLARPSLAFLLCARVLAHDGPQHEIDELTEKMTKEGATADLLTQRAIEYRVLGKLPEAIKDLERAATLDASSPMVLRELGRTYFANGKTNEALSTVTRALDNSLSADDRASLLMVRAEVRRARKDHERALEDANEAIEAHPDTVDWYLFRSQLHQALKLKKERIEGLEGGIQSTGSAIIEDELVDAWIDDEQYDRALAKVEAALDRSRWRASWLIRRAKISLGQKKTEAANADLKTALAELERRMNVASPDPLLLAERGLANDLLGNDEEARRDLRRARDKGLTDEWILERLQALGESASGGGRGGRGRGRGGR